MFTRFLAATGISSVLVLSAVNASAQGATPAAGSLKAALNSWALQSLPPGTPVTPEVLQGLSSVTAIGEITGLQVSTAPVGSSTGGFTFTFDSQLQTWKRSADTFGPIFSERALTTGKGRGSVGVNFLHSSYSSIGGLDVSDGSFQSIKNPQGVNPAINPIAQSRITLDVKSDTVVTYAVFGVTNNLDIGAAVPWVRVSLGADQSFWSAAGTDLSAGHHVVLPQTASSGIGDVVVFGKYHFLDYAGGGLAGELAVQLPTGDTDNLRGAGVTRTSLLGIWSLGGKVSPHANVGYEFWSSKVPFSLDGSIYAQNQAKYAVGVEFEASPRATVSVDLVGRRLLNGGQLGYQPLASPFPGGGAFQVLVPIAEGVNDVSIAPGIKWNPFGRALVSFGLLGSLANKGLRANVTPLIGFDWDF